MIFFVTGGSRGIGEAIVLDAARAGHDVAFTYKSGASAAEGVLAKARELAPNGKFKAYQLDVADSSAVEAVADQVLDDFDTVHVVVSNAGINVNGLAANLGDDDWKLVLDTNLSGTFYVCRQFLPTLVGNRFGRIIMISSLGRTGVSGQVAYATTKAGMIGMSTTLAKEYGRRGITCNVVAPGFIDTDMSREGMSGSNKDFWLQYCPVGRVGAPDEVSKVVLFLASEGASYVNGATIQVTGGLDWAP